MKMKKVVASLLVLLLLSGTLLLCTSALSPHGNDITFRSWAYNDPDYTFSDGYTSSVWYKNFARLTLTDNERNNVLRVAISQIGYHEGNTSDDFGGMNTEADGNVTEYARLIRLKKGGAYGEDGVDYAFNWCACFVNWCLSQARIDHAYAEISCGRWISDWYALPENDFYIGKAFGGTYTPRPADLIFFDWDGKNSWPDHIGIVLGTDETTVYTIEGNTKSNDVGVRSYPLDSTLIRGYGVPAYDEGGEPIFDFMSVHGLIAGEYIVQTANTSLVGDGGQAILLPIGSTVFVKQATDQSVVTVTCVDTVGTVGTVEASALLLLTPEAVPDEDVTEGSTESETEIQNETKADAPTESESVTETDTVQETEIPKETAEGVPSETDSTVDTGDATSDQYTDTSTDDNDTDSLNESQVTTDTTATPSGGCGATVSAPVWWAGVVAAAWFVAKRQRREQ